MGCLTCVGHGFELWCHDGSIDPDISDAPHFHAQVVMLQGPWTKEEESTQVWWGTEASYVEAKLARLLCGNATCSETSRLCYFEVARGEVGEATLGEVVHGKAGEAMLDEVAYG